MDPTGLMQTILNVSKCLVGDKIKAKLSCCKLTKLFLGAISFIAITWSKCWLILDTVALSSYLSTAAGLVVQDVDTLRKLLPHIRKLQQADAALQNGSSGSSSTNSNGSSQGSNGSAAASNGSQPQVHTDFAQLQLLTYEPGMAVYRPASAVHLRYTAETTKVPCMLQDCIMPC